MSERKEAWMRVIVAVISGIILSLWKTLVIFVTVVHWLYVVFANKRSRGLADFCNLWATQAYRFVRYLTFTTNARPFPFSEMGQPMHPTEFKSKK